MTTKIVNNALAAMASEFFISHDMESPCWVEVRKDDPEPKDVIPLRNGLLDVSSGSMTDHTPRYYCAYALSYNYDKKAPKPAKWLEFLRQIWPNDPDSIRLLQQWFGYSLTSDTSLQKILLVVGPPRSGKGTIARIWEALIGHENVSSPTLGSIGTRFGLWGLQDKLLTIFKDAHMAGSSSEKITAVERLKSISGEDSLDVEPKGGKPVKTKFITKLAIFANETPNFRETSGALAMRMTPLKMTETFAGKEDDTLTESLMSELSGILNWAIEGLRDLRDQKRFTAPSSATGLREAIEDAASPVGVFVDQLCLVVNPDNAPAAEMPEIQDIFAAWCEWCRDGSHEHGNDTVLGRNIRAIFPHVESKRPSAREKGKRPRRFSGIRLTETGLLMAEAWKKRQSVRQDRIEVMVVPMLIRERSETSIETTD